MQVAYEFVPREFPWLSGYQRVTPTLVFDDSISYEQQMAGLAGRVERLVADKLDKSEFEEFYNWLVDVFAHQGEYIDHQMGRVYRQLKHDLELDVETGDTVSVAHGGMERSVDAMREMYNDLAVFGITVDELASLNDFTVDDLTQCGLTCRGLSMYSDWLVCNRVPECVEYDGEEGNDLYERVTVGMLANADMVEDHIYVNSDARPLTVGDLAESDILEQYFISDDGGDNSDVADVTNSVEETETHYMMTDKE